MLILATGQGVFIVERDGEGWREVRRGLEGRNVTSVIAREGTILVGTRHGVYRSDDLGETWVEASAGLSLPYVRWLAYHPEVSDLEFAGTEPAGIFASHDGAQTWRGCAEVEALRDKFGWWLPYSPGAGCVRGFAFHGDRAYAAVEVGGVLRSDDRGETWFSVESPTGVSSDVHSIEVHPTSPDLVTAATNSGLYRSLDGGATWSHLYQCYTRAVWVDPLDANHMVFGPADTTDRGGRVEVTRDGGQTWADASAGLGAPWRNHMVERLTPIDSELFAVLSNGELWSAPLATLSWQRILPHLSDVNAVASMG
jgi:photosystem II stability/assembly factor-like uncharacterized protein